MWEDGLIVVTLLHIHSHSSAARTNNHVSLGLNISIDTPSRNMGNNGDDCPREKKCKSQNKIVGGCQVEPNTFPWQAFVLMQKNNGTSFKVEVGKHRRNKIDGKRYGVNRVIPHPNYPFNSGSNIKCGPNVNDYDFAILELKGKIPLNTEKGTKYAAVYLPDPSDGGEFARGDNLVVSGWGNRKSKKLVPNCKPRKLNAVKTIQIDDVCREEYTSFKDDIMICVGSKDYPDPPSKGTCQGDSGGPLVWLDKSTDKVKHIGVVSFGRKCTAEAPSVLGKMTAILNNWQWEGENIAKKLRTCNAEACGEGQCMTGSDLDDFVKSRFFD